MSDYAELYIEDSEGKIDLLDNHGILMTKWLPKAPEAKNGGLYGSSPFVPGKYLLQKVDDNINDAFTINVMGSVPNDVIERVQDLRRKLIKATQYWTSEAQTSPVWIVARSKCEPNKRYSVIVNYSLPEENDLYSAPFMQDMTRSAEVDLVLGIEHLYWQAQVPGTQDCVPITDSHSVPSLYNAIFNGTTSRINLGSDAVLDDLHSNDFCVEGWIKPSGWGENNEGRLFDKTESGLVGWLIALNNLNGITAIAYFAGGTAISNATTPLTVLDGNWHHYACQFRVADKKWLIFWDGTEIAYNSQIGGIGAVNSDAANSLFMGNRSAGWDRAYAGDMGWNKITVGMIHNVNFATPARCTLPDRTGATEAVWIYAPNATTFREFYGDSALDGTGTNMVTEIECYRTVGEIDSCEDIPFSTFFSMIDITHAYFWDNDLAVFSANIQTLAMPHVITPAVPAAGDYLYIGSGADYATAADNLYGPFQNFIMKYTPAALAFVNVEYWNGAWVNLTSENIALIGSNRQLTTFQPPADWVTTAVNGVTGWWVRIALNGLAQTSVSQALYCANRPWVDILAEDVKGDVEALFSAEVTDRYDQHIGGVALAVVSHSRNPNFIPAITASRSYTTPITITPANFTAIGVLISSPDSPDGTCYEAQFAGIGSTTSRMLLSHQIGNLRHFVWLYQNPASTFGDVVVKGTVERYPGMSHSSPYYGIPVVPIVLNDLKIQSMQSPQGGLNANTVKVDVTLNNTIAAARTIDFYGTLLYPIDEWIGEFYHDYAVLIGQKIRIGTEIARLGVYSNFMTTSDKTEGELVANSSVTPPILHNNADQRLCIYAYSSNKIPLMRATSTIKLFKTERYLSARGTR